MYSLNPCFRFELEHMVMMLSNRPWTHYLTLKYGHNCPSCGSICSRAKSIHAIEFAQLYVKRPLNVCWLGIGTNWFTLSNQKQNKTDCTLKLGRMLDAQALKRNLDACSSVVAELACSLPIPHSQLLDYIPIDEVTIMHTAHLNQNNCIHVSHIHS